MEDFELQEKIQKHEKRMETAKDIACAAITGVSVSFGLLIYWGGGETASAVLFGIASCSAVLSQVVIRSD